MKTKSELLFEEFLSANDLKFEKIKEEASPRPDYMVTVSNLKLIFEVKELAEDDKFGVIKDPAMPNIKSSSRILGDHIRRRIEGAKKQIQYGTQQGIPSILLIYNNLDPVFQAFGTEDLDFKAAMYGELTVLIDKKSRKSSEVFNGKNQMLQERKNTSFSAIGRLFHKAGETSVTLFENAFSKITVPYDQLPPCFEVQRVEITSDPLSFT